MISPNIWENKKCSKPPTSISKNRKMEQGIQVMISQMLSPSWEILRIYITLSSNIARQTLKDRFSPQFAMCLCHPTPFLPVYVMVMSHVALNHSSRALKFHCPPSFHQHCVLFHPKNGRFSPVAIFQLGSLQNGQQSAEQQTPPGSRTRGFFIATNVPNLELLSWFWVVVMVERQEVRTDLLGEFKPS